MAVKPQPFKTIAGVTPCPGGWLVIPARLAGVTTVAEEAFVLKRLGDVLDHRPRFEFVGLNVPMAFNDEPSGPYRECDELARELVGWPRRIGFKAVPSRRALLAPSREAALRMEPWLTPDDLRRFPLLREVAREIQPFHSRSIYAGHADLSYWAMNGETPLRTSPFHRDGVVERIDLLRERMPGVDDVVQRVPPQGAGISHMLAAGAMLFTARRASGRAISRLPLDPEWDANGLRLELVR
jgi:predicted RNase H-like nuclease